MFCAYFMSRIGFREFRHFGWQSIRFAKFQHHANCSPMFPSAPPLEITFFFRTSFPGDSLCIYTQTMCIPNHIPDPMPFLFAILYSGLVCGSFPMRSCSNRVRFKPYTGPHARPLSSRIFFNPRGPKQPNLTKSHKSDNKSQYSIISQKSRFGSWIPNSSNLIRFMHKTRHFWSSSTPWLISTISK